MEAPRWRRPWRGPGVAHAFPPANPGRVVHALCGAASIAAADLAGPDDPDGHCARCKRCWRIVSKRASVPEA